MDTVNYIKLFDRVESDDIDNILKEGVVSDIIICRSKIDPSISTILDSLGVKNIWWGFRRSLQKRHQKYPRMSKKWKEIKKNGSWLFNRD